MSARPLWDHLGPPWDHQTSRGGPAISPEWFWAEMGWDHQGPPPEITPITTMGIVARIERTYGGQKGEI